jgi:hypothetical protein
MYFNLETRDLKNFPIDEKYLWLLHIVVTLIISIVREELRETE